MSRLRSRLLLVGIATFIVGLVAGFPARVAYRWFVPPGVVVAGISGTIWRGHADEARAGGIYFRDIGWQSRPLALFTGKLAYRINASPTSGFVESTLAVTPTGALELTGLRGALPLSALDSVAGLRGVSGDVSLQFDRLRLEDGVPVAMDGDLEIAGLTAPLVHRAPIGGYRAEFRTGDDGVGAAVEDTDGVFDLAGNLQLNPDRSYQFTGLLAPKAETPERLRRQLPFLGSPNDRGQYQLRFEGSL